MAPSTRSTAGEKHVPMNQGKVDKGGGESDSGLFQSVGRGFLSLFGLQLVSRALTFSLNIAIARAVDRDALGRGAVQLQLITDAILTLSREGFRDALQRTPASDWRCLSSRDSLLRVSWLSIPLGGIIAALILLSGALGGSADASQDAALVFAAASLTEMLAEPLYVLAHNLLLIHVRVRVEMVALAMKTATVALVLSLQPGVPLMAFAGGQLAFGVSVLACFVGYFTLSNKEGIGARGCLRAIAGLGGGPDQGPRYDPGLVKMCATMSGKSLLKFAMDRGETFILLSIFPADVWALYSIVQNLGSLVVRLVLFPIEDMSQLLFSKLCSAGSKDTAGESLSVVLRLVILIGCFCASFGPGYAYSVIHILYGAKWSTSGMPLVLSWYSWCLPLMSANGVTEAFLHASASPRQIATRSALLLPITGANLMLSYYLAPSLGVSSLIIGSMASLGVRTVLSLRHADSFLPSGFSVAAAIPSLPTLLVLGLCGGAAHVHDSHRVQAGGGRREDVVAHVVLAFLLLGACVTAVWQWESKIIAHAREMLRSKGKMD